MDKRSLKNIALLVIFVLYTLLYKGFIFPNYMKYSDIINASFFIVFLFGAIKCLGYRKDKMTILTRNILKVVVFHLLLIFVVMYGVGFFVGFLRNAYSRTLFSMFENLIGPFLIIIFTIALIVFECFTGIRSIDFNDWSSVFRTTATIILPVIVKNTTLTYICYHVGYKLPILYRVVMDLYIFVVPVIPDLGEYVNSMISISLPLMIYISSFGMVDYHTGKEEPVINSSNFDMLDIPITIVLVIVVSLISGLFPHYMIGVGSESMSPALNKGDAVILKKVKDYNTLQKDDIIAYKKGKLVIVHRIVDIEKKNGKTFFITKGDANGGNDPNRVKSSQVKGIVVVRVPYIAYPTIMLNEYLNSR